MAVLVVHPARSRAGAEPKVMPEADERVARRTWSKVLAGLPLVTPATQIRADEPVTRASEFPKEPAMHWLARRARRIRDS